MISKNVHDTKMFNLETFHHFRKYDCYMTQDMISFAKLLQTLLIEKSDFMRYLKPKFVLVGSAQEGTRIGIGNEIDMTMQFTSWEDCPPFEIALRDAFHLYKSQNCPKWMEIYFNRDGRFNLDKFTYDVCQSVDNCINIIFTEKQSPHRLKRVISNSAFANSRCEQCKSESKNKAWPVQCVDCIVCVSRTKMGVCLQFEWKDDDMEKPAYCSMDLVPVYNIRPIDTKVVLKLVNSSMLQRFHPSGWFSHIKNYLKEDRVVEDLWSEGETIEKVLLKCLEDGRYFIRGGQRLKPEAFFYNENLRKVYILLKVLRTTLDLKNLSNFMIKKMLMDYTFVNMASTEKSEDQLLYDVLSHNKFQYYFRGHLVLFSDRIMRVLGD